MIIKSQGKKEKNFGKTFYICIIFILLILISINNIYADNCFDLAALYRTFNIGAVDHFYTPSAIERDNALRNLGYTDEGVAANIFNKQVPNSVALYRLHNPIAVDHFYTIDELERDYAILHLGYINEGIVGYIYTSNLKGSIPLYRLFNIGATDHFYTTSLAERNHAILHLGYTNEGIAGYVFPSTQTNTGCNANEVCVNEVCKNIECNQDSDCNDNNPHTQDSCLNPGSVLSSCSHKTIECLDNNDCDDNNSHTQDVCSNPGSVLSSCSHLNIACVHENDCNDNNSHTQDFCLNPGTALSICSYTTIECLNDSDCNDNNPFSEDKCINPGKNDSRCDNKQIICFKDSDCGIDQFIGNEFCNSNDLFKNFITFKCNIPGTGDSYCTNLTSIKIILDCGENYCEDTSQPFCKDDNVYKEQTCHDKGCDSNSCFDRFSKKNVLVANCQNGCNGGQCVSECIDSDQDNYDTCNPGDPGDDGEEIDCNDNNPNVHPNAAEICNTVDDDCDGVIDENNGNCVSGQTCSNGQCLDIRCSNNFECGTDGFIGSSFCQNGNVFRNFKTFICNNPGCSYSSCSFNVDSRLIEACSNGCSNGVCINQSDCNPPVILLINPENNSIIQNNPVLFIFNVSDESSINNCKLVMDENNVSSLNNPNQGINNVNFSINQGNHEWYISCTDIFNNTGKSEKRKMSFNLQCLANNNCGSVISSLICLSGDIYNKITTPTCVNNSCQEIISYTLNKECNNGCSNGKCISSGGGGHNPPINEYQDFKNYSIELIGKPNGIYNYNYTNSGLSLNQSVKKVQTNNVQTKKNNYLLFIDVLLLLLIILLILIVISILLR